MPPRKKKANSPSPLPPAPSKDSPSPPTQSQSQSESHNRHNTGRVLAGPSTRSNTRAQSTRHEERSTRTVSPSTLDSIIPSHNLQPSRSSAYAGDGAKVRPSAEKASVSTDTVLKPSKGSKARKGVKCHQCNTCRKIFTRHEHLRRHHGSQGHSGYTVVDVTEEDVEKVTRHFNSGRSHAQNSNTAGPSNEPQSNRSSISNSSSHGSFQSSVSHHDQFVQYRNSTSTHPRASNTLSSSVSSNENLIDSVSTLRPVAENDYGHLHLQSSYQVSGGDQGKTSSFLPRQYGIPPTYQTIYGSGSHSTPRATNQNEPSGSYSGYASSLNTSWNNAHPVSTSRFPSGIDHSQNTPQGYIDFQNGFPLQQTHESYDPYQHSRTQASSNFGDLPIRSSSSNLNSTSLQFDPQMVTTQPTSRPRPGSNDNEPGYGYQIQFSQSSHSQYLQDAEDRQHRSNLDPDSRQPTQQYGLPPQSTKAQWEYSVPQDGYSLVPRNLGYDTHPQAAASRIYGSEEKGKGRAKEDTPKAKRR